MADQDPFSRGWGQDVVETLHALHRVSEGRVIGLIAPRTWSKDELVRLGNVVARVLDGGAPALRAVEHAVEEGPCCG